MRTGIGEAYEASTTPTSALHAARGPRLSLRRAIGELQAALAAPVGAADVERLVSVLDHLRVVFAVHVEVTESQGGLYEEIMEFAPRLANRIARFKREHAAITTAISSGLEDLRAQAMPFAELQARLTHLLQLLVRHRKRGADLVYEAYHVDIGGES
ncbi:MAG TPA: hemerythrin domain-containing protein [Actinomycetes bacterium]|nr:hemerythrin domain-containing protein [Actinomycetes bacterium]